MEPGQQDPAPSETPSKVARGLEGVFVGESKITLVDGSRRRLLYRGYDVAELARHSSYEETAYLLWHAELPSPLALRSQERRWARWRTLPRGAQDILHAVPPSLAPLDALRSVVSTLDAYTPKPGRGTGSDLLLEAEFLTALAPTLVAGLVAVRNGKLLPEPHPTLGHAANFLAMLRGEPPTPQDARILDAVMILHADHEMNTSTFAARMAASTRADVVSGLTSGLAVLKGPLHGGAGVEVMRMVDEIGDPDRAEEYVRQRIARHERLMGFGHRVYRGEDPRATVLRELSREISYRRGGDPTAYEILERVEKAVRAERGLSPNVDLYSGSIYAALGIPREWGPTIFAVSRFAGWTAHLLEEYADSKLISPQAVYAGPPPRPYPVTDRTHIRG